MVNVKPPLSMLLSKPGASKGWVKEDLPLMTRRKHQKPLRLASRKTRYPSFRRAISISLAPELKSVDEEAGS
jgi:hypothetical protein